MIDSHPLDHVVWNALTSKQSRFAVGDARALRYPASIAPFAALADSSPQSFDALPSLIEANGSAALVTTGEVLPPSGFSVVRRAALVQMVQQHSLDEESGLQHIDLGEDDVPDMLALTTATQPGPFGPNTVQLGRYLGIRNEQKLVAMAGERMSLDGFTEISAVCVDAAFRGQGYAGGLMSLLISTIRARGETPFLHVLASNEGAIRIYRTLGFVERRTLNLTVIGRAQG